MALPPNLSNLHNVFCLSQLRKYDSDPSHLLEPESVQLREDLTFNLLPTQIMDCGVKQLRNKTVLLVKVAWGRGNQKEYTWKLESEMKNEYPDLFIGNEF